MEELAKDPNRRFIYVEQAFFQRWWRQQDADMQARVRKFVDEGQLEFISGGWVMHDEAAPVYTDMIAQVRSRGGVCERRMPARSSGVPFLAVVPKCDRLRPILPTVWNSSVRAPIAPRTAPSPPRPSHCTQTELGHRYILSQFGAAANPRVGWQVRRCGMAMAQLESVWDGRASSSRCGMAGPARVGVGWHSCMTLHRMPPRERDGRAAFATPPPPRTRRRSTRLATRPRTRASSTHRSPA